MWTVNYKLSNYQLLKKTLNHIVRQEGSQSLKSAHMQCLFATVNTQNKPDLSVPSDVCFTPDVIYCYTLVTRSFRTWQWHFSSCHFLMYAAYPVHLIRLVFITLTLQAKKQKYEVHHVNFSSFIMYRVCSELRSYSLPDLTPQWIRQFFRFVLAPSLLRSSNISSSSWYVISYIPRRSPYTQ